MKKYLCIAAVLSLSACGKSYHEKDWYIQHDAEREARVRECENDPAQYLRQGSDCLNAKDANGAVHLFGKEGALKQLNDK